MYVLTVDRRASRREESRVPMTEHLAAFRDGFPGPLLRWQLSAGDELQALYDDAHDVLHVVLALGDSGSWHVGLGIGSVDEPLPTSVHEATGAAFVAAREAVTAAKDRTSAAVRGSQWAEHVESVLALVTAVRRRRTATGGEASRLADTGMTQLQIAEHLDIAQSSVSRRLSAAQWHEEQEARRAVVALLELADGTEASS